MKYDYWIKSGTYSSLHRLAEFGSGFLVFLCLVRILPKEDFGVWVLFMTIFAIIDMARTGFLQNGLIRFLVQHSSSSYSRILTAGIALNAGLTLVFILLLLTASQLLENWLNASNLSQLLYIHCIFLPAMILHTQCLIIMQAKYNFKAYFFAGLFKSIPLAIIVLFFYFTNSHLSLITLGWIFNLCLIMAVISAVIQTKQFLTFEKTLDKMWLFRIFHFGKFVFGTNLISTLYNSLDKFLLGALLSPIQVALANTASKVLNIIEVPIYAITSVSFPKATESNLSPDRNKAKDLYEKSVGAMLAICLPLMIISLVFAKEIVWFMAGELYLDAVPFLQVIVTVTLIKPFDRQAGVFLDAINKPELNMKLGVLTFFVTLICSLFFIKLLGFVGAAIAIVLALLITSSIKQYYIRKFIGARFHRTFLHIFRFYRRLWLGIIDRKNIDL